MSDLATLECVPCRGGIPPLTAEEIAPLQERLGGDWEVINDHHLQKEYRFDDFKSALAFTNLVGDLAEAQGHHPDIHLGWGRVGIDIWTHKIMGLTESDFVLAAKIDTIEYQPPTSR